MLFPIPARVFVLIIGAISLLSSVTGTGGGVAHATHLGGLVAGYLYLEGGRGGSARRSGRSCCAGAWRACGSGSRCTTAAGGGDADPGCTDVTEVMRSRRALHRCGWLAGSILRIAALPLARHG